MAWVFNPFTGTFDWTAAGGGGGGSPGGSSGQIQYNNGGSFGGALLTYSAGQLQLGAADVATGAVAQTLQVQSNTGAATTGPNFTIKGSSGTTAGGSIIFQTHNGTAFGTALTIASNSNVTFGGSLLSSGANFYVNTATSGYFWSETTISTLSRRLSVSQASDTVTFGQSVTLGWTNQADASGGTHDLILARDGTGILAQRRTTTAGPTTYPQVFRVYSSYTDAANNAYGGVASARNLDGSTGDVNTLYIGSQKAGSPSNALTKLAIQVNGATRLDYGITNSGAWSTSAKILSTDSVGGGYITMNASTGNFTGLYMYNAGYGGSGGARINSPSDASIILYNYTASDFDRLMFGGRTSSFPALKRTPASASLQVRLADDSGDAALQCGTATSGGTAFNVNGTGGSSIASITNTSTGTLLQVLNSTSNPLMTVTDTTSGTLFSVQSTTAATLFSVNDTTSGTLLAVTNSSATDVLTVTDGSLTGSAADSLLSMVQTWNTSGTPTSIKLNVTDTASNAASLLMDLQVGGTSKMSVAKTGTIAVNGPSFGAVGINLGVNPNTYSYIAGAQTGGGGKGLYIYATSANISTASYDYVLATTGFFIKPTLSIGWASTSDANQSVDLFLTRATTATLQLGAADVSSGNAVAQFLRVQSTTAASQTAPNFTIQGSRGTTAGGSIIFQTAATSTYATALTLKPDQKAEFAASIKTAAPTTGTAAEWKLGSRVAATTTLDTTQYIELDVGGTLYKLAVVTS